MTDTPTPIVERYTPGPWEYVPSNENHGAYVTDPWGGDVCDCYTMSNPSSPAVCNGGDSRPIPFQHEFMDANARLIAAAPDLLEAVGQLLDAAQTPEPMLAWANAVKFAREARTRATGEKR